MKVFSPGILTLVFFNSLILFSCSKYEEGSASMRTKENRLCQKWKVDEALVVWDDTSDTKLDITTEWKNGSFEFRKDASFSMTQYAWDDEDTLKLNAIVRSDINGSWEFFNKKTQMLTSEQEKLVLLEDGSVFEENETIGRIWRIVKLQKNELWLWFYIPNNSIQHNEFKLSLAN